MLANFFNKSKPITTLSLVVLLFLYYLIATFFTNPIEVEIISIFKHFTRFILLVFVFLVIDFVIKKNHLTEDNSFALLIAIFLFGMFFNTMFNTSVLVSNLALLLGFRKVYSLKSGLNTKQKIFDAGFWFGLATAFYLWAGIFLVLIFVGILVFQKASVKNLMIPFIGFITPIFIWFTYLVFFDQLELFYHHFLPIYSFNFETYNALYLLIPITFLVVVFLWSLLNVLPRVNAIGKNFKWSWTVLLWNFFFGLIITVLAPTKNGSEIFFILFPTIIIIANFLQRTTSEIFKNIILYLFLIISIGVYFIV